MTRAGPAREILRRRLAVQRLTSTGVETAADAVRLLCCVQSQECAHAFWSVGMRTRSATYSSVLGEFDRGAFLRTHILRPTWHFVAPEDLRWLLAVTSPRVQQVNGTQYRAAGLDPPTLRRAADVVLGALAGGNLLTRVEIGQALAGQGIEAVGPRLAHVVMYAELEGLVCSGPMRGNQHTYAVLDERVPPAPVLAPEEALGELAVRFFTGHGPADVRDLARWASLRLNDARAAVASVADRLEHVEVGDHTLWFAPDPPASTRSRKAFLLPLYDEATLTYPRLSFPAAPGHPHRPDLDTSTGSVVHEEVNVGTWRRRLEGRSVVVETSVAASAAQRAERPVRTAVERLAAFLGRPLAD